MAQRFASILAALAASALLLFLAAPIVELIGTGGAEGLGRLGSDAELRASLALTAFTATAATLLGVIGGTPLAYLLARREFPGRAVLSAVLDLPLLIPHPEADLQRRPPDCALAAEHEEQRDAGHRVRNQ